MHAQELPSHLKHHVTGSIATTRIDAVPPGWHFIVPGDAGHVFAPLIAGGQPVADSERRWAVVVDRNPGAEHHIGSLIAMPLSQPVTIVHPIRNALFQVR